MISGAYKIDRGVPIPRNKLHPNDWNPNHTKPRQQEAIAESVSEYGQVIELVVQPHPGIDGEYRIIDGEHRYNAMPDIVYCNVIHDLPDHEAKKLTVILNETRGAADKNELAQLLSSLDWMGKDLIIGLPYEQEELDELVSLVGLDWGQTGDGDSSGDLNSSDRASSQQTEWVSISAKVPHEVKDLLDQAMGLIEQQRGGLHGNQAIAWGQVFESLAADYLAGPH